MALSETPDAQAPIRSIDENPRVLIISGQGEMPQQQVQILLRYANGMIGRDMLVLLHDINKAEEENLGLMIVQKITAPSFDNEPLSPYSTYINDIDTERFSVTLIGKDQGVKKTWNRLIDDADLFGMIDRMPMRLQEMRR